jgi:hypothetical protein
MAEWPKMKRTKHTLRRLGLLEDYEALIKAQYTSREALRTLMERKCRGKTV